MIQEKFYREAIIYTVIGIIASLLLLSGILHWKCLILRFLHFECPGCGFTRGTHCLLHGDVVQALKFNPLVIFYPAIIAFIVLLVYDLIARKNHLYRICTKITKFLDKHFYPIVILVVIYNIAIVLIKNRVLFFG